MSSVDDLRKFVTNLKRGTGVINSKVNMRLIAQRAIELIQNRTRKGFGVYRTGANEEVLKPLSDRYLDYRKKNRTKLDQSTTPYRSNLTFTGTMLRSMTIKLMTNTQLKIGPNNRRRKGGLTNSEIAAILSEKGRPFNNLSSSEVDQIVNFIDYVLQLEIVDL